MDKKTVQDIDVRGKRALVRVDFNVPLKDGVVQDDTRIRAALPTINYLLDHGAKVILMSHLGRPKGERKPEFSLSPVADVLASLLGKSVAFCPDCIGETAQKAVADMVDGDVLLLENLRFYAEEEKNDSDFAAKLAALGDIFVNDAFGTAHRAHASTEGVAHLLPAVSGFLMAKELAGLGAVKKSVPPFIAIMGGAKISDKIGVIQYLLETADKVLTGGGIANTLLAAKGYNMEKSLVETEKLDLAKDILASPLADKLLMPVDLTVAPAIDMPQDCREVKLREIPAGWASFDIGSDTCSLYAAEIAKAGTVFWNGPMGVFEVDAFSSGTMAMAQAVADCSGATVVGGGDSVAAIQKAGVAGKIYHISTGGGASLEFVEGKVLPGIAALKDSE